MRSGPCIGLGVSLALVAFAAGQSGAPRDPAADRPAPSAASMKSRSEARKTIERNRRVGVRAPDFGRGKEWFNAGRGLTLRGDFAGRVVLIDFWTYCCINCQHVLPDLAELERKFDGQPFAVIGVHSAKFENEKDGDNIRDAIIRYGITHPVVNDAGFSIWSEYGVSSWPTQVLAGPDGRIIARLSGEGHRAELEDLISAALKIYGAEGALEPAPIPVALERDKRMPSELSFPGKVLADAASDRLFIADTGHHRIVVTDLSGQFLGAIGDGTPGLVDGPFRSVRFNAPQGMALRGQTLFVADTGNHAVRRVDLEGRAVATIAGRGRRGFDRTGGKPGREVDLASPWDLALVGDTLYVAMAGQHQIWTIDLESGIARAWAGTGREARIDGPIAEAALAQPSGLATDGRQLYIADSESSSVRAIDIAAGKLRTLAGASPSANDLFAFGDVDGIGFAAKLQHPLGVALSGDVLFVADSYNHRIKRLDLESGLLSTLSGRGKPDSIDGPLGNAFFSEPGGLSIAGSRLFVADTNNQRVRVIDLEAGSVATLDLSTVPLPQAGLRRAEPAVASDLPVLPGAVKRDLPAASVHAGRVELAFRLSLPEGRKLVADAPSAYQVLGQGRPSRGATLPRGRIDAPAFTASLDVPRSDVYEIRLVVYHCREASDCRVSSVRLTLPLLVEPDGAARVVIDHAL